MEDCSCCAMCPQALYTETKIILLLRFTVISLGFAILGDIFAYVTVFESNHSGGHIPSSWMVHAGCVSVAGIHQYWTLMSGSFESVRSELRLHLGLCSHPKGFCVNGVRTHVNSKGKIPLLEKSLLRGGWNPRHSHRHKCTCAIMFYPLPRFPPVSWPHMLQKYTLCTHTMLTEHFPLSSNLYGGISPTAFHFTNAIYKVRWVTSSKAFLRE